MRGRRGQEGVDSLMWTIIDLFMLLLVLTPLIWKIQSERGSMRMEKKMLAKGLSSYIDGLYASPDPITVRYPGETYWFNYHFLPGKVRVYQGEGEMLSGGSYFFIQNDERPLEETFVNGRLLADRDTEQLIELTLSYPEEEKVSVPVAFITNSTGIYPRSLVYLGNLAG